MSQMQQAIVPNADCFVKPIEGMQKLWKACHLSVSEAGQQLELEQNTLPHHSTL